MAAALRLFAAASLLLPLVWGCSTPPGGCTLDKCKSLWGLTPPYQSKGGPDADKRIGWIYGVYNKNLPRDISSKRGGPVVNWEVFPGIDYDYMVLDKNNKPIDTTDITNLATCCAMCAQTDKCRVYQFFDNKDWTKIKTQWDVGSPVETKAPPYNFWGDRQCYLYTGGIDKQETDVGAPYSGTNSQQQATTGYPNRYIAPSWVGGLCNGNTSVVDDPHFTGAQGTRFEFNGEVDETFALISDRRLHLNVKLGGYLDDRTFGATKTVDGKAVRTWIREIGLLWIDAEGAEHKAVFVARKGRSMEREEGFISSLVVDGTEVFVPQTVGDAASVGTFSLGLLKQGKKGVYDVDLYELKIQGLLTAKLRARAAHPLLQTQNEAFVHFNIHVDDLQATDDVHGVLGQTFRNTISQTVRALEYKVLSALMRQPIVADGDSGKGFLDGEPGDYKTSGILATDAKFSSYAK